VDRKVQQQTLSIRISESLREFLERSKNVISAARGESVSTSDVAKILLESAKDDRLDDRLEVAELQQHPTETLCAIRRKWENQHALSRAELIFLAQYIQVACEKLSENPAMPGPEAFLNVLEALVAIRELRTDRGAGLDRYYLENLGLPDGARLNERQIDSQFVGEVIGRYIEGLRASPNPKKPTFAGRNLYVALRDEVLPGVAALNDALAPRFRGLFQLAARGHWLMEGRPARILQGPSAEVIGIPTVQEGAFRLMAQTGSDGEISLAIDMEARDLIYPVGPYPYIREFAALLEAVAADNPWPGFHYAASAVNDAAAGTIRYQFRRPSDGVTLFYSEQEWLTLRTLFRTALAKPNVQSILAELSLVYGEL
jgi:hypothetical protein